MSENTEEMDCPMCNAPQAFIIDPLDPAVGYCTKEQTAWRIKPGSAVCHVCLKVVPTRYCESCELRYCNEGEDDDRFCAIEHENRHEDGVSGLTISPRPALETCSFCWEGRDGGKCANTCHDTDCPIGSTIVGWPHDMTDEGCTGRPVAPRPAPEPLTGFEAWWERRKDHP